ncbi:MAG TPA: FHA domain-containing protein [Vicinamibacteria bacterium]|jgi:DNA-binding winged helix-turn-helix (wHTH) protein|nr:FHA domain-containing protein [Vicinamibacteria bacterium]
MRVSFSEFVLETATRQLFRSGTEVHLEPKAFELLELLLARRPEAVSKTEIHGRLWPDTFVSESSLTGLVAQVRKALADDRRQERFLRTIHGFGYAFSGKIAAGAEREPPPAARLIWEESVFVLKPGDNVLGRSEEASVRIDAPGVSRRHARIVVTEDRSTIEDLASKNGTFLCERRLDGPTPLRDGDVLRLGRQLLVFRSAGWAASTRTDSPPPARSA